MEDGYIGTIMLFAGNFAPKNWAYCDGQLLPIAANQALFSIIGATYGGDGRTTFALPDLRGRYPLHPGTAPGLTPRRLGEKSGQEYVTLTVAEIPNHGHNASGTIKAKEEADVDDPTNNFIAGTGSPTFGSNPDINMNNASVQVNVEQVGGSQSHNNMPPFLGVNYIICLHGLFPTRT